MTIQGNRDVVDITSGTIKAGPLTPPNSGLTPYKVTPGGIYSLSYSSNISYNTNNGKQLFVNKCIVYNTTDSHPDGWFYILDTGSPLIIRISETGYYSNYLFAFVIDILSVDNSGIGTVTVTQIG
ncbi:hypothetical protein [Mucilaginibacter oryzae]|nr:hypothetical protein [Mucilaginibacter oryzae]